MPKVWEDNSYTPITEEEIEDAYQKCFWEIFQHATDLGDVVIELPWYEVDNAPLGIEIVGFRFETYKQTDCEKFQIEDFHFIWRDTDGKWWHKPGGSDVREFDGEPRGDWKCDFNYNFGIDFLRGLPNGDSLFLASEKLDKSQILEAPIKISPSTTHPTPNLPKNLPSRMSHVSP